MLPLCLMYYRWWDIQSSNVSGWVNPGSSPHALCNAFGLLLHQLSAAQTRLRILFYVSSLERRVSDSASDFPASCFHFIFTLTSGELESLSLVRAFPEPEPDKITHDPEIIPLLSIR